MKCLSVEVLKSVVTALLTDTEFKGRSEGKNKANRKSWGQGKKN